MFRFSPSDTVLTATLLALLLFWPLAVVAATPWPALDAPPRAQVAVVADDLRIDGIPTQIRRFQTSLGVAEVLAFYRTLWKSGGMEKATEAPSGQWQAIARKHGEYWLSVQVKATLGGGSEGYLAASLVFPVATRAVTVPALPLPVQSHVLHDVVSVDPGKESRLLVAVNDLSTATNVRWFEKLFRNEGFRRDTNAALPRGSEMGHAAVYLRGSEEIVLTIARTADRTAIVLNRVIKSVEKAP